MISQVIGAPIEPEALISSGNYTLKFISIAAIIMVAAYIAYDLPYRQSIVHQAAFDVMWTDNFWRQVSGWTMVGLGLLTVPLTLRKRLGWFGKTRFGLWRAFHASVGIAAVSLMLMHSGMRLGANLNQALGISFLTFIGLGALAGWIAAIENSVGGQAIRRWRYWTVRLHIWLLALTAPLLIFHVITVYVY